MGETARNTSSSSAKKVNFMETLKKGLGGNKVFEASLASLVDVVGAAARLGPEADTSGLRGVVPDIYSDLKVSLFLIHSGRVCCATR